MGNLTELLARANDRVAEETKRRAEEVKFAVQAKIAKTPSEIAEINAKVKAWHDAQEWTTVGSVVRFETWHCACGAEQLTGPGQELVKQLQRVFKKETRLVAPTDTLALPLEGTREVIFTRLEYKICASFAHTKGY